MQLTAVNHAFSGDDAAKKFKAALSADAGFAQNKADPIDRMLSIAREQQLEREARAS